MSYRGRVFTGQMTQPTVSKHRRNSSPKDRLQSHQVHLTMLQSYTGMQYTVIHLSTVKWAQWDKTQSRELLGLFMCVHCTVHNCCTEYCPARSDLIIFPPTLQTITIAPMMSIWGKRVNFVRPTTVANLSHRASTSFNAILCTYMRPVVTDRVAWSVCLSVCLLRSWSLQKWLNWSRCPLGCGLGLDQGTMY